MSLWTSYRISTFLIGRLLSGPCIYNRMLIGTICQYLLYSFEMFAVTLLYKRSLLTLHLQPLPRPDDLRGRVAPDLALEVGVAALGKPRIAEDLLEDRRRGALLHGERHG